MIAGDELNVSETDGFTPIRLLTLVGVFFSVFTGGGGRDTQWPGFQHSVDLEGAGRIRG